jgi:hypothetical protein
MKLFCFFGFLLSVLLTSDGSIDIILSLLDQRTASPENNTKYSGFFCRGRLPEYQWMIISEAFFIH